MLTTLLLAAVFGQSITYEPSYDEDELIRISFDPGDTMTSGGKVAVFWNSVDERLQYEQIVYPSSKQTLFAAAPPATYLLFANILVEKSDGSWVPRTERIQFRVTPRGGPGPGPTPPDPPGPTPPVPPSPVPPDNFDNIGQRVDSWADELQLPLRAEIAVNYQYAAVRLVSIDDAFTVQESAAYISSANARVFDANPGLRDKYSVLSGRIAPVWAKFVDRETTKFEVADFYSAIFAGLSAR